MSAEPGNAASSAPHVDLDQLLHHTELPETGFSRRIDPLVRGVGKVSSYIWVVLVAVITVNVLLRYVAGKGLIEFEEGQWHLYAIAFLLALAWAVEADDHVRIDVISDRFAFRTKCWIELVGIVLALLPFLVLVVWYSFPFIAYSFRVGEISEAPGGLPYRWAIKSFLLIGFVMLALAALSRLTRVAAALFTRRAPQPRGAAGS
jgi:TRAP-type mannitol/chloroaromatic compound transport system permease small subunit